MTTPIQHLIDHISLSDSYISFDQILNAFEERHGILPGELSRTIKDSIVRDDYFMNELGRKVNRAAFEAIVIILYALDEAGVTAVEKVKSQNAMNIIATGETKNGNPWIETADSVRIIDVGDAIVATIDSESCTVTIKRRYDIDELFTFPSYEMACEFYANVRGSSKRHLEVKCGSHSTKMI